MPVISNQMSVISNQKSRDNPKPETRLSPPGGNPKPETQNPPVPARGKLKITFLTGEYPPLQGGIADHIYHLATHLTPLNIESSVLISRRWLKVRQAPHPTLAQSPEVYPVIPNWGWRCWLAIPKFLKTHQPHLLHIQYQAAAFDLGGWVNWLPWYLRKIRNNDIKIVTTFHDLRIPYIFPKAGPLRWKSILALARHSHAVICTNREDYNQLAISNEQLSNNNHHPPIQNSQFTIHNSQFPLLAYIPLGSNIEVQPPTDFSRTEWRAKYGANDDTLLLAYFGFLNASKGGEELIEALALLHQHGIDARLLLIGGDVGHADPTNAAYAQQVQALIDRHGLADVVYRTGYVALPEVSANLLAADAVVMPYRDGVSFRRTTLIAALRHGCPVVSTIPPDPTFIPEIEPGENMLLALPQDAVALAQTIAPLADTPALREKLSKGAKALGNLFEWDRIARQTADLYRAVSET